MWMLIIWICVRGCEVHEVAGRYSTVEACQIAATSIRTGDSGFISGSPEAVCVPAPDKDPMMFE